MKVAAKTRRLLGTLVLPEPGRSGPEGDDSEAPDDLGGEPPCWRGDPPYPAGTDTEPALAPDGGAASQPAPPPAQHTDAAYQRLDLVGGWVGGTVHRAMGNIGEVDWERGGYRFRYFEKSHGPGRWSVVLARTPLRVDHGFQVRPVHAQAPFVSPLRQCRQSSGLSALDRRGPAGGPRIGVFLAPDAPDALPIAPEVWVRYADLVRIAPEPVVLDVQSTRAWVTVPAQGFNGSDPRGLLEIACRLLDVVLGHYAKAPATGKIKIMQVHDTATDAVCPVCAEEVAKPFVRCAQCGARHHTECWQYMGACSVYGCRSTQIKDTTTPPGPAAV